MLSFFVRGQCRLDYKHCYMSHRQQPSQQSLTTYIDSHNAYVQQLHTTNAMLEAYHCETIPQLMQELQDVYADLCAILSDAIFNGADIISSKVNFPAQNIRKWWLSLLINLDIIHFTKQAGDQLRRYDSLTNQCKAISPQLDLNSLVKILQPDSPPKVPKKSYAPPAGDIDEVSRERKKHYFFPLKSTSHAVPDYTCPAPLKRFIYETFRLFCTSQDQSPIPFRNELIVERSATLQIRPSVDALKRETIEIESQIKQLQVNCGGASICSIVNLIDFFIFSRISFTGESGVTDTGAIASAWKSTVQQIDGIAGGYFVEKIRFIHEAIAFGCDSGSGEFQMSTCSWHVADAGQKVPSRNDLEERILQVSLRTCVTMRESNSGSMCV